MKCLHCNISIHKSFNEHWINSSHSEYESEFFGYCLSYMICPECKKPIIELSMGNAKYQPPSGLDCYTQWFTDPPETIVMNPKFNCVKVNKLVPDKYAKEFIEAANTMQISPKASATLSRRLLQMVLQIELKIKKKSLDLEIQEYEKRQGVSSEFIELLQLLRQVGNFGAHPKKVENASEIVEIEEGEAEILLAIIEKLFDEVFVKPQLMKQSINTLKNKYLKSGGKP